MAGIRALRLLRQILQILDARQLEFMARGLADHAVGFELRDGAADRPKVAMLLLEAIQPLVVELNCSKVALSLDAHDAWLVRLLYAAGFEQHGTEMMQVLGCKMGSLTGVRA